MSLYRTNILLFFLIVQIIVIFNSNVVFSTNDKFLIVAESFIPFEFVENGIIKGIDIDLIHEIFISLDLKYEVQILPWARAWKMMEFGYADSSLSTSIKPKRKKYVFYPKEDMWLSEYVFFVKKEKYQKNFNGFEDAIKNKLMIGIIRGNSYHKSFWKAFPNQLDGSLNPQLEAVKNVDLNFKKLLYNRIDLYIIDKTIGLYTLRKMGLSKNITYYKNVIFTKGYPMAFSKKSKFQNIRQIIQQYDNKLKLLKNNGTYDQIMNKWLH